MDGISLSNDCDISFLMTLITKAARQVEFCETCKHFPSNRLHLVPPTCGYPLQGATRSHSAALPPSGHCARSKTTWMDSSSGFCSDTGINLRSNSLFHIVRHSSGNRFALKVTEHLMLGLFEPDNLLIIRWGGDRVVDDLCASRRRGGIVVTLQNKRWHAHFREPVSHHHAEIKQ